MRLSQAARSSRHSNQTLDQFAAGTRESSSIHVSRSTKRASEIDVGLMIVVVIVVVMVVVMVVVVTPSVGGRGDGSGGDADGYHGDSK